MTTFIEKQSFTKNLVFLITMPLVVGLTIFFGIKTVTTPGMEASGDIIIPIVLLLAVFATLSLGNLKTIVNGDGFQFKMFPFHFRQKTISWNEIENIEMIEYQPIRDYGGWGIRLKNFSFKHIAYNVSGTKGILISLKNGKKVMIGSQKVSDDLLSEWKKCLA